MEKQAGEEVWTLRIFASYPGHIPPSVANQPIKTLAIPDESSMNFVTYITILKTP
jgi:hypothetical protein